MFKTKSIRIVSIVGILLLLVLQYIWFKNSFDLMEHNLLVKCKESIDKAVESELYERLEKKSINLNVQEKNILDNDDVVLTDNQVSKSIDINTSLQELSKMLGLPCSVSRLDTLISQNLDNSLNEKLNYTVKMVDDSTRIKSTYSKYTLYNKITEDQYLKVTLISPIRSVLREAQLILIISLFLAVLIGVILIIQLQGMLRESKFVTFLKEYTHALTHELKTPISGIYMSSSMLTSGKLEGNLESRQKHYQICKDQSSKLLKTVERILLVAKAEHSAIIPDYEVVTLQPYIEKIAESYRLNNYRQKNLEITTSYNQENIVWNFDPTLMENVLSNLIDNAIKYSESTIKIQIICECQSDKLKIHIKDNGFGISEKEIKHIFDNFERGNKVDIKGIDGFGIGLNYVQKVIKAHKGSIMVDSTEGVGSEFIIDLYKN